ncbi:MAG: helix-turn-helix transcriptional regulator [Anaerolineaceae bacterium]|jgi:transcriptional regulator with XRE-family HTH domain|nr:helix-turn-helix transcriptional regulator [Anaerolineaceae bacterium]
MVDSFVGQKLKLRRGELNLSLRAVSAQTGLSAAFLSQIERGESNPSLKSLQNIANALGVNLNYFLAMSSEPTRKYDHHLNASYQNLNGEKQ